MLILNYPKPLSESEFVDWLESFSPTLGTLIAETGEMGNIHMPGCYLLDEFKLFQNGAHFYLVINCWDFVFYKFEDSADAKLYFLNASEKYFPGVEIFGPEYETFVADMELDRRPPECPVIDPNDPDGDCPF